MWVSYTISVSFIEFLRKFCVYDEIFDISTMLGKRFIKFERLKIRSNLGADQTGFRRLGHILAIYVAGGKGVLP